VLAPQTDAAFSSTSTNGASVLAADTLGPPTALAATRACVGATPTAVASSSAVSTTSSITVPRPSEVMEGDLVLLVITGSDASGPWSDDGWTGSDGYMAAGGMVLRKIATAAEPSSYTVNGLVDGVASAAVVLVYRGVDPGGPVTWIAFTSVSSPSTTIVGSPYTVWSPDTASLMIGVVIVPSYTGVVTPGSGWSEVTSATQPGGLPGAVLVVDRPVVADTGYSVTATVSTARTGTVMTFAARPATGAVDLSWTASADPAATGYSWTRSGSGSPASGTVVGRATSSLTDATLPAAESATYTLTSTVAGWASTPATVTVPACA
jgi:hypothetical protein